MLLSLTFQLQVSTALLLCMQPALAATAMPSAQDAECVADADCREEGSLNTASSSSISSLLQTSRSQVLRHNNDNNNNNNSNNNNNNNNNDNNNKNNSNSNNSSAEQSVHLIAVDCGLWHGPPNTVLAGRRALAAGAAGLNVDLALTRDQVLVGLHSQTSWVAFPGFPDLPLDVSQLDFSDLPKTPPCSDFRAFWRQHSVPEEDLLDLKDCQPQELATAEDFLRLFPDVPLHFDLKAPTFAAQMHQARLLDALVRQKFPSRLEFGEGMPLISVRFFQDPLVKHAFAFLEEPLQVLLQASHLSLPIFIGDPSAEDSNSTEILSPLPPASSALVWQLAHPELAPAGIKGAYLPPSLAAAAAGSLLQWQDDGHQFSLICDEAWDGLIKDTTWRRAARQKCSQMSTGTPHIHTAVFRSLGARVGVNMLSTSNCHHQTAGHHPSGWGLVLRGSQGSRSGALDFGSGCKPQALYTQCAGKLVTSMLVMKLIELGKIPGLDVPIVHFLELDRVILPLRTTLENPALQALTLRHAMMGVSGVGAEKQIEWKNFEPARDLASKLLADLPWNTAVGRHWRYTSNDWVLVERAVEVGTRMSFPEAARTFLFDQAGVSAMTFYTDDTSGCAKVQKYDVRQRNFVAAVGLCATADDLYLLGQTLADAGISPATGKRVLSVASVKEVSADQLKTHFPEV
ncbi:unnamed protein product, partial [Polarella glacialis]